MTTKKKTSTIKRNFKAVNINNDTHKRFKKYCDKRYLKMGRIVNELVEGWLEEQQKK